MNGLTRPESTQPRAAAGAIPNIIAITGGKGGVGKTSISVNLAIALSRLDHRVCLLDGDTGLANVNILLGLRPQYTLEQLITGEQDLPAIMLEGPEGLKIIPGATGVSRCADLDTPDQMRLIQGLQQIESNFDWLLVDTAAGIGSLTVRMVEASQMAAIVITPEPTSLTDAFSLLKVLHRGGYRQRVLVLVNMVTTADQPQAIFRRFQAAVNKYIGLESVYLGSVWMDESMRMAVTSQRPVATLPVDDPSCRLFIRLAERLLTVTEQEKPQRRMSDYWLDSLEQSLAAKQSLAEPPLAKPQQPAAGTGNESNLESLLDNISAGRLPAEQVYSLLCGLLQHADTGQLSPQQLNTIGQLYQQRFQPEANREVDAVQDNASQTQPTEPVIHSGIKDTQHYSPFSALTGGYDVRRFGSQESLARAIRQLGSNQSLNDYLSER